jgi:hypothetical protein
MALEPGAIQAVLGFIPMPIALAAIAFLAMEVKEKVRRGCEKLNYEFKTVKCIWVSIVSHVPATAAQ